MILQTELVGVKMQYTSIDDLQEMHLRESYALVGEVLPRLEEELRRRGGNDRAVKLAFEFVVKRFDENFLGPHRQSPMEIARDLLALTV